jgi:hypothetical protein
MGAFLFTTGAKSLCKWPSYRAFLSADREAKSRFAMCDDFESKDEELEFSCYAVAKLATDSPDDALAFVDRNFAFLRPILIDGLRAKNRGLMHDLGADVPAQGV